MFRFVIGIFNSMNAPAASSLIANYFPLKYRSTANAIEQSGEYVGAALASSSVLLIKKFGWREMYMIHGVIGVLFGIFSLIAIKEPKRVDDESE